MITFCAVYFMTLTVWKIIWRQILLSDPSIYANINTECNVTSCQKYCNGHPVYAVAYTARRRCDWQRFFRQRNPYGCNNRQEQSECNSARSVIKSKHNAKTSVWEYRQSIVILGVEWITPFFGKQKFRPSEHTDVSVMFGLTRLVWDIT